MAKSANKLAIIATTIALSTTAMGYSIYEHKYTDYGEKVVGTCNNGHTVIAYKYNSTNLWEVQGPSGSFGAGYDLHGGLRRACGE